MKINLIMNGLWLMWVCSWAVASRWSNTTVKRLNISAELKYRITTFFGVVLLFGLPGRHMGAAWQLWHVDKVLAWTCVALMVIGFAFAWWARIFLGRFWSSSITHKEDHRLIDNGPYAIVRHPIYTGIGLSMLATVAQKGTVFALAGGALVIFSFWLKARLEEDWLSKELGIELYANYKERVPMLVPFTPIK